MIQSIYFANMPDHLRPARNPCPATSNRAVRLGMRDASGSYAKSDDTDHFFKHKVLPLIEAARRRGDIVRFLDGWWIVNGKRLGV